MAHLEDVAIFVSVVEEGSFANAARRLKLPPTTVSRRVRQLEEALGARLLHRTTRSLALTEAGQRYFEACRVGLGRADPRAVDAGIRSRVNDRAADLPELHRGRGAVEAELDALAWIPHGTAKVSRLRATSASAASLR